MWKKAFSSSRVRYTFKEDVLKAESPASSRYIQGNSLKIISCYQLWDFFYIRLVKCMLGLFNLCTVLVRVCISVQMDVLKGPVRKRSSGMMALSPGLLRQTTKVPAP